MSRALVNIGLLNGVETTIWDSQSFNGPVNATGYRRTGAVSRIGQPLQAAADALGVPGVEQSDEPPEGGRTWRLAIVDPLAAVAEEEAGAAKLTAPMPGKIITVKVENGAKVERGQALLVMEAMKMEHTIRAPADGIVAAVHFAVGDQVEEGVELLDFQADGAQE